MSAHYNDRLRREHARARKSAKCHAMRNVNKAGRIKRLLTEMQAELINDDHEEV